VEQFHAGCDGHAFTGTHWIWEPDQLVPDAAFDSSCAASPLDRALTSGASQRRRARVAGDAGPGD
jgi:hypothetical protein